ncbi:ribosome 60S biogenesis N-terminal-domain-containing protein [Trametes polyzona]|nr:ribosome 60S biogenesis N-terminal-domain-containing protein [Trametes polyzona]
MPTKEQPQAKKRKVQASLQQTYRYRSAKDIQRALKAQSEAGLIEGLNALRNQFTIKSSETSVAVNDERLVLAKEWLDSDPGAQELFNIWETTNSRQMSLLAAIVGLVAALLNLLSSHYTYHAYALPILRTLLSQQWAQHLNLYLGGQHTELILVTLKLYNALSNFAGGRERKAVLDAFAWEMKSLPKLLQMRRKSKGNDDADVLQRPDIRTLYILLVLTFLDTTTTSSVKSAFLEQHRDAFAIIFKGLWQDSYSVMRRVLEVCWAGLWSDAKLKRTLKIQVFNETTLSQLLRIYERNVPEGSDPESVPADVVHHFLLALCSHPGTGLCFHDRGWYPRETDLDQKAFGEADERADDSEMTHKGGRIYNKILANVVKTLKVNEDPRQQELALKILAACPELVTGYWSSAGLALEPRLSSKWLANIAFFGSVVSLPVPTSSFFLPESGSSSSSLYQPSPPPLSTIIENILPTAHIKTHLSRGLQASSPLVQHASALALAKCLLKYDQVVRAFQEVERALEEDEEEGLWGRRRREVEREVRKRVPDFQVVVGFSQRLNEATQSADPPLKEKTNEKEKQKERAPNPTRTALLTESAHRLLWLYHRLLPSVVAEARFDAGKLLQAIEDMLLQTSAGSPTAGLDTLRQLHVLRLLRESEHFTWSGKSGSKHSNFHIMLKAYTITPVQAVRTAIVALLRHILSAGVLFQHDADEIALWLDALPLTRRVAGAQSPDGAPLTDEGDGVISFLDDCVQRCVKTPYKYVEELQAIYSAACQVPEGQGHVSSIGERPEAFPSPLLATVLEQLGAKLRAKLLSASDALALFTFVRRLLLRTAGKSVDLHIQHACAEKLAGFVDGQVTFSEHPTMAAAIRREVSLLRDQLAQLQDPQEPMEQEPSGPVQEFLSQVEKLEEPASESSRQTSASELVDWLRLIGPRLHPSELTRLVQVVDKFYAPAVKTLLQFLNPREISLWAGPGLVSSSPAFAQAAGFDTLFLHCSNEEVNHPSNRAILIDCLFASSPDVVAVKRAIRLILHRLSSAASVASRGNYLRLLGEIVGRLGSSFPVNHVVDVVAYCFDAEIIKSLCSTPLGDATREGLGAFLDICSTSVGDDIQENLAGFIGQWALTLRESLDDEKAEQVDTALLFFKYSKADEAISLLGYLADRAEHSSSERVLEIIQCVLDATVDRLSRSLDAVTQALPLFSRLHALLPQSQALQSLLSSGVKGSLPLCFDGYPPERSFSEWNIVSVVPSATKRWSLRLQAMPSLSADSFISAESWTDATAEILTTLLYRRPSVRPSIVAWLESSGPKNCSTVHLVTLVHALYDSARDGDILPSVENDAILDVFARLVAVIKDARHPYDICSKAVVSVSTLVTRASNRSKLLKILGKELGSVSPEKLHRYSLATAARLSETLGAEAHPLAEQLVDLGLKWAVRHFSDHAVSTEEDRATLSVIATLAGESKTLKSHLVEPVIAAVVQERLGDADGLRFVRLLATATNLKPVAVNKYLQTVVQHSRFFELCLQPQNAAARDGIIALLHTLFHLHPTNTCQPSHIEPLRRVYGGSLGKADRQVLSIFQLFEATRKTSVASLLGQWSGTPDVSSSSALEALQSLEPSRVLRTCLDFPQWRTLAASSVDHTPSSDGLYDPVFVLLLLGQLFADRAPTSALEWVQLFRTNVVSLLLRALSAKDSRIRDIAWAQTAALYRAVEEADLQEKPHVMHILNLLKDVSATAPTDEAPRLPAYTTLLLAHAFRGIFYPSNFIYPLTARFLLQRPTLDPSDVPMLYGMLYSSSDDWKKERAWIVRFLSDGIVGNEEWRILKRRHTWDLLASLFQSEDRDKTLRRGVLEVLANVTCNARATTSLVLRHALLSWIEMQLQSMRADEAIAWARILENILAVVNPDKIETATDGEWRAIASRCVRTILNHPACSQSVFLALVPVILRVVLLPGRLSSHTSTLLARSLSWLEQIEGEVAIPTSGHLPAGLVMSDDKTSPVKLHRSHHLFDQPTAVTVESWGECVESLWRVSMTLPTKTAQWDALSSRLLVWRSIAGPSKSPAGEWARREVLENLQVEA